MRIFSEAVFQESIESVGSKHVSSSHRLIIIIRTYADPSRNSSNELTDKLELSSSRVEYFLHFASNAHASRISPRPGLIFIQPSDRSITQVSVVRRRLCLVSLEQSDSGLPKVGRHAPCASQSGINSSLLFTGAVSLVIRSLKCSKKKKRKNITVRLDALACLDALREIGTNSVPWKTS